MALQQRWAVRFLGVVILLFGTAIMAGCAEAEPDAISWYYGASIRYNGLGSTFAWSPQESEQRPYHHHGNPQFEQFVRTAIEKALEAKGFAPAAGGPANFWIDYRIGKHEVEDSSVNPHGEVFEEGTLVLDVLDPKAGGLIWRGVIEGRIDDTAPPDIREKRLRLGVQGLMKDFPSK